MPPSGSTSFTPLSGAGLWDAVSTSPTALPPSEAERA
eukprot:CAMPEP_0183802152 /NCGR_PEP_ID=MMETSP0803_2-20130417/29677_1 /TAXON_ID=195967 /ORGANISM="Crustomastix stigmata, Strain CCMP3273" /LENGTH=36 /DNA_ID= /DNA_START= /DNA_END= /DNA_ORIENTATION=